MPRVERERSVAARVASSAELEDVRLFGAGVDLHSAVSEGDLSYSMASEMKYQALGDPVRTVIVTGEYAVTVNDAAANDNEDRPTEDESDPSKVAELRFNLAALFGVDDPEEGPAVYSDEELEAFAATTGQFALYPYAREFISDMTSRMGLPALHIGTLRLHLDSRTGD